jgi:hypothetical protein
VVNDNHLSGLTVFLALGTMESPCHNRRDRLKTRSSDRTQLDRQPYWQERSSVQDSVVFDEEERQAAELGVCARSAFVASNGGGTEEG